MAAILPDKQIFQELLPGTVVGIHLVTPVSTSDTFTVPSFAQTATNSVSSETLRRADANTATITDDASSNGNTVTVVGTAGNQIVVVTLHRSTTAFGNEDNTTDLF